MVRAPALPSAQEISDIGDSDPARQPVRWARARALREPFLRAFLRFRARGAVLIDAHSGNRGSSTQTATPCPTCHQTFNPYIGTLKRLSLPDRLCGVGLVCAICGGRGSVALRSSLQGRPGTAQHPGRRQCGDAQAGPPWLLPANGSTRGAGPFPPNAGWPECPVSALGSPTGSVPPPG